MSESKNDSYQVLSEYDVEKVTAYSFNKAIDIGFDNYHANMLMLAVSEIATNQFKYAINGLVVFNEPEKGRGIRIEFTDGGPGISNIKKSMVDGYSEDPTSLGLGLGVAKRAVDLFDIQKIDNSGLRVILEKYLPLSSARLKYDITRYHNNNIYQINEFTYQNLYGEGFTGQFCYSKCLNKTCYDYVGMIMKQLSNSTYLDIEDIKVSINKAAVKINKDLPLYLCYIKVLNKQITMLSLQIGGNFQVSIDSRTLDVPRRKIDTNNGSYFISESSTSYTSNAVSFSLDVLNPDSNIDSISLKIYWRDNA